MSTVISLAHARSGHSLEELIQAVSAATNRIDGLYELLHKLDSTQVCAASVAGLLEPVRMELAMASDELNDLSR